MTELAAPPFEVLCCVGVKGHVGTAVGLTVSLGIADEIHSLGPDRTGDGHTFQIAERTVRLRQSASAGRPAFTESTRARRTSAASLSMSAILQCHDALLGAAPFDRPAGIPVPATLLDGVGRHVCPSEDR